MPNKRLAEELHKPIIRNLVHSSFAGNIWGVNFADMQLESKFNKGSRFLPHVIDVYWKLRWDIPFKNEKGTIITNAFQNVLNESNCKSNKKLEDKSSEFYNRSVKPLLEKMIKKCIQHIIKENLLLLKD